MRILIVLFFLASQISFGQEFFGNFNGSELLPDSLTRVQNNIAQINRRELHYFTRHDKIAHDPKYLECRYYNKAGDLDSSIQWSGDSDDPILCTQAWYFDNTNPDPSLREVHVYLYYNAFSSQHNGQWLTSDSQLHYYWTSNKTHTEFEDYDSALVQKIKSDTTHNSWFLKRLFFYENGLLKKDSSYLINPDGTESRSIQYFFYNENNLKSKVSFYHYDGADSCVWDRDIQFHYNEAGDLVSKIEFSNEHKDGKIIRSWTYDKNGNLIYEEIAPPKIGIKSRKYKYDSSGRMIKIKETHANGYVYLYTLSYNENGFLQKIQRSNKWGKYIEVQTFTYITFEQP